MVWKNISYGSLTTYSKKMKNGTTKIVGVEMMKYTSPTRYKASMVVVQGFLNPIRISSKTLGKNLSLSQAQTIINQYKQRN